MTTDELINKLQNPKPWPIPTANLATRIEGIIEFNPYDVATRKVMELIKAWALEMVGDDETFDAGNPSFGRFNTPDEALLANETRYLIKERIKKEFP